MFEKDKNKLAVEYGFEAPKEVELAPDKKQTIFGILLGIGYLTVFTLIPYFILIILFGSPTTYFDLTSLSSTAQMLAGAITLFVMGIICKEKVAHIFNGFKFNFILKCIGFAFLTYLLVLAISYADIALFGEVEDNANQAAIIDLFNTSPVIALIFTCVLAPVIEEVIFRYFIYKPLEKKSVLLAIVVSGLSFALIHLVSSFENFIADKNTTALLNDLRSLATYLACGAMFCFIYWKTKHLICSILTHVFYNTIASVLVMISMTTVPLKAQNVVTFDNGFSFEIVVNESYEDTLELEKIEVYYTDSNNNKVVVNTTNEVKEVYTYSNLQYGEQYYVTITYNYDKPILGSVTEETVEEVNFYVFARER